MIGKRFMNDIIKTKPDILFVALGSPKQEKFIMKNKNKFKNIKIIMPVGGTFDVVSKNTLRAPLIYRNLKLEWLYRMIKEPKRFIYDNYQKIDNNLKKLESLIKIKQKEEKSRYIELVSKLDALSPLKTLSRGYTLTQKENKIIKSAKDVKTGDEVSIKFIDGTKSAKIL